jgi:hypothetical protein
MKMSASWVIAPCSPFEVHHPDDGGSKYLRQHYSPEDRYLHSLQAMLRYAEVE